MIRKLMIAGLLFGFFSAPVAHASGLAIDLSSSHVDVTSGFDGTTVSLFGVHEGPGEVAVVVRGPAKDMSVRRKENFLGAWVNRGWMSFKDAPVYYYYALSGEPAKMAPAKILKDNGIGLDSIPFKSSGWIGEDRRKEFLQALIRNKQNDALYSKAPGVVKELGQNFFRADFYLPSRVPVGKYTVQAFYIVNGKIRDVQTQTLKVAHVGVSAQILKFSDQYSFFYGLLSVVLAVFAGWFSNRVRRKA